MVLRGSCLCGAVTYEADGPIIKFPTCYCSRCRKATGSARADNIYVDPAAFRWLSGADTVRRFDLPQARSFATAFCASCGSPMPHPTRSGREVVIPAGSLDVDPGARPSERAHWDSRAPWVDAGGD
jgi:hypothetical protein